VNALGGMKVRAHRIEGAGGCRREKTLKMTKYRITTNPGGFERVNREVEASWTKDRFPLKWRVWGPSGSGEKRGGSRG